MSTPRPTATGSLDSTPLLNLLIYALDHRLTGSLVLEEQPGGYKHAIYFAEGAPGKIKTAEPTIYLGHLLVELGLLSEEARVSTLAEAQAARTLHGVVLRGGGHVDDAGLRVALREQLSRQILYLATRPSDTLYGYYDQVNLLERWGGTDGPRARPLEVIWRVIEKHADPANISEVLGRLQQRPLRLHVDAPIQLFCFNRVEQSVLEVMRAKSQPVAELLARDLGVRERVERLLYALAITRQLDLGVGSRPVGVDEAPSSTRAVATPAPPADFGSADIPFRTLPSDSSPASPPGVRTRTSTPGGLRSVPPESPEVAAFRQEIEGRAERSSDTHYEVLGLPKDVPQAEIQPAFLSLAKKWHPDRVPAELADLKEQVGRIFTKMTEASQALSDPQQRREYDLKLRRLGREAEEQEHIHRVLRAAMAYQKAEVFLKRNNLAAAEVEARQALADDPDQADHIALVAWIDSQKPDANLETAIRALDRAVVIQPNNVRTHWYRGVLYQRLGKMSRAMSDFRVVVERDPRHVDAQREIRLFNMRRGERSTSIPPSGDNSRSSPGLEKSKSGADRVRVGETKPEDKSKGSDDKSKGSGEGGGFIRKLFKR